jgi:ribosomal protein S18 acetylase RimI-like enzyme
MAMNPVALDIRAIRLSDLPQLLRLCCDHAAYENAAWSDAGQAGRWEDAFFAARPALYGWVADRAGVLVGFMTVTVDYATWSATRFAHMDCLFVDAIERGHGIGCQFITCLAAFCRAHGLDHAQWQTPPDNAAGIAFYRRIGATGKPKLRFFLDCGDEH